MSVGRGTDRLTGEYSRGFQKIIPSKAHEKWFKEAMTYALVIRTQLRQQGAEPPIQGRLRVEAKFYLNPRSEHEVGDLNGYEQALADFLQEPQYSKHFKLRRDGAGIIVDDKQISSWGESTRDLRDKVNPRIEVSIEVI